MKRIIALTFTCLVALSAWAQDGLRGKWNMSESKMGVSVSINMSFDGEASGKIYDDVVVLLDISAMGISLKGEANVKIIGSYTLDGGKMNIVWDLSSYKVSYVEPIEAFKKNGEPAPDIKKKAEEMMEKSLADVKESLKDGAVYTDVRVDGSKLRMNAVSKKGKAIPQTYSRVR